MKFEIYNFKLLIFFAAAVVFLVVAPDAYAAVPTTTSITPNTKVAGSSTFTITVDGTNFVSNSRVRLDGSNKSTTFVSATRLTASISASDIDEAGTFSITVFNSGGSGGTSNAQTLTVTNPVPTTTSISPTSRTAYSGAFTLTVNGTNFNSDSAIYFNGSAKSTNLVNSTRVTASLSDSDIASVGLYSVTVVNPTPGGGTSNAQSFSVTAGFFTPTTTSILPTLKVAGSSSFTLTVNGTGFIPILSSVNFNGSSRSTNYVSSTQLTATIPSSDLVTLGSYNITVTNSIIWGGISNAQTFTVGNPVPVIDSINPTSKYTEETDAFTMTVTGSSFIPSSVIYFDNFVPMPTTYISSTQVSTTFTALPTMGDHVIAVYNPTPGGGFSGNQTFSVLNTPPEVSNAESSLNYCPVTSAGSSLLAFSWDYSDFDSDSEYRLQLQIDNNSNFPSPVIDRTLDNLLYTSPANNQQSVMVEISVPPDSLAYGSSYYWRVRACQAESGALGACSDWLNGDGGVSFTTPAHPKPYVDFTASNTSPAVNFTNNSVCFNASGANTCASYEWDFDDGETFEDTPPLSNFTSHSYDYDEDELDPYASVLEVVDTDGFFCSSSENITIAQDIFNSLPLFQEINPLDASEPLVGQGSITTTLIANNGPGGNVGFAFTVNFAGMTNLVLVADTNDNPALVSTTFNSIDAASTYAILPAPDKPGWTLAGSTCTNGIPSGFSVYGNQATKCTFVYNYAP